MNKSELSRVFRDFDSAIANHIPDRDNFSAIVGVSGGPDSMTLLYLIHLLGIKATVVHCNYQLRGKSSEVDQELVEEVCSMWDFECVSVRFDSESAGKRGNFQNRARMQRYQVFLDMKRELKADAIILAHHQDDQLETIIQKIMRGSGVSAWQGMQEWDGRIFRPLLNLSKANILEYASENNIPYRLDSSNEESTYARNFLRNGWFPVLDDLFPGWRDNLLKVQERGREHETVIATLTEALCDEENALNRERFLAIDSIVRVPVLLHLIKKVAGHSPVSADRLESLPQLDELQTGKKVQLNEEWSLLRDRDHFVLQGLEAERPKPMVLSMGILSGKPFNYGRLTAVLEEWKGTINKSCLQIDADSVEWPLTVRAWEQGDRLNPLGMDGSQTVADLLTNRKVSALEKARTRVVETDDSRICAVLFPKTGSGNGSGDIPGAIADWARCKESTGRVLCLDPDPPEEIVKSEK